MSDRKLWHHKGFALLEVLVAIGILAIGILALTKFQGGALRSGSDAKARTVATNLAQERMELLRNFNSAAAYDAIDAGADPNNPIVLSGTAFAVEWNVDHCDFPGVGVAANCIGVAPEDATFKRVTVNVSWTDPEDPGTPQVISLESFINANPPTDSGRVNAPPASNDKPVARHRPGAAPEIISIAHGGDSGSNKETTTPEPDTMRQSGNTLVRFEEVTFSDDGDPRVLRRDDNLTLNCVCVQGRSDSQVGLAPTLFNADKNRFVVGDPVAGKQAGQAATGNETVDGEKLNLSAQPEICDICCRDHHDYTGVNAYDPFRPSGDRAGDGNHNHYFPDSSGVLQLANNSNDLYVEACRMVRVDGIWRVTPDWRLEGLQVLPSEFLQTNADDFRNYVRQFVKEYVSRTSTASGYPQITPNPADFTSLDYATALEALPNSEDGDELSLSTLSASQRKKQLHAFGLYIDYMGDTLINELQTRITSGDESFMESVPFHLVNVTRLANWSASSDAVSVSDQPIADGSEATYSRGLIAAVNPGNAMVTATLERSNTGFTDTRAVDGDDEAFGSDALNVVVDDGTDTTPGIIVSGTIGISGNIDTRPSDIRVTGGNGAFCTKPTDETYACTLDPAVAGNTITFSNYNYLVVDKKCNSAMVFDNKVSPETGSVVVDNKQHAETTSFTFTDVTDSLEMNIEVKKDFGKQACPSP